MKAFGRNLKRVRESKRMTQEDLAEKTGMAQSTIARIESGLFNSTISSIAILAKSLNVDKRELLNF